MKRYLILVIALIASGTIYAQEAPKRGFTQQQGRQIKGDFAFKTGDISKYREMEKAFGEATKALKKTPDDKNIQKMYINALRSKIEYKKKVDSLRKCMINVRKDAVSSEKEAFIKAKKTFGETVEKMEQDLNSPKAQKAVIEAQKAVFIAEKAIMPLYIIDDKECESLENVDRRDIEKSILIKNDEMIKKYGDKAKNGVIIITTKKDGDMDGQRDGIKKPNNARMPMDQMRMQHITKVAQVTDKQKDAFSKVYNQYTNEIEVLRRANNKMTANGAKVSSSTIENIFKNNIAIEQKRMDMYKELGKTLSSDQLAKVYRADLDFARIMMNQYGRPNQDNRQQPTHTQQNGHHTQNDPRGHMPMK